MKFCPKCGTRLKFKAQKPRSLLFCEKCGFSENAGSGASMADVTVPEDSATEIKVVGEKEEKIQTMPTTNVECPKCGHGTAFWWFVQTRSGDEPPTQFFRCQKCGHTWRQYS
ncbi:MAG: transcription factor S [Nitrososphaerales archaeon]